LQFWGKWLKNDPQ